MLKNHRLAKALSDASLSSFLEMLKNKAERISVKIVEADTFYPSSKTCSHCGAVDSDLSLSDRTYLQCLWSCPRQRLKRCHKSKNPRRGTHGEVKRLWRYCKTSSVGAGIVEARR